MYLVWDSTSFFFFFKRPLSDKSGFHQRFGQFPTHLSADGEGAGMGSGTKTPHPTLTIPHHSAVPPHLGTRAETALAWSASCCLHGDKSPRLHQLYPVHDGAVNWLAFRERETESGKKNKNTERKSIGPLCPVAKNSPNMANWLLTGKRLENMLNSW